MAISTADRWRLARYNAYQWRVELSLVKKIALMVGMAAVVGLAAQVRVPLPWTPIPITGQTFAVLLAGIVLGRWWGGASLAFYAGAGAMGMPWFTGWSGGMGYLAGPTGGYIIGFVLAALFVGHLSDRYVQSRRFLPMLGVMLTANFALIYIPGLLQLYLWLNLVQGGTVSVYAVLGMGLLPFIAGDIIKAVAAGGAAWGLMPKQSGDR
ncbi:MAG: biotin transporter BioY [Dehalococcoidales bacterium]